MGDRTMLYKDCIKCGYTFATLEYTYRHDEDYLKVTCCCCGYDWSEPCNDKT